MMLTDEEIDRQLLRCMKVHMAVGDYGKRVLRWAYDQACDDCATAVKGFMVEVVGGEAVMGDAPGACRALKHKEAT